MCMYLKFHTVTQSLLAGVRHCSQLLLFVLFQLQIPLDENLEEFWIDFNVGSRSISFYVAADDAVS